MFKISMSLFAAFMIVISYTVNIDPAEVPVSNQLSKTSPSTPPPDWPAELEVTNYTGPDLTPSPACLAVAPTGQVFVGVDMIGSLGKTPGKGSIIKLYDTDNDGKVDKHTTFAMVDNPRGILPVGDKVYVLHTTFSKETGKATGMDLVVYVDSDQDGVADAEPKPLIEGISNPKFLQSRGTDHATNGIRMGIDGWIYIAVGDFGFHDAVDRSGKKLTMQGGGIVRVRPDGTEMEIFSHGMRNIYDVAIDPYMNIFTRDNTNDGGGWNIRFSHQIQSGEYGYPLLFQHFTDEIIPALVDVGGGSGTGSIFMDDPTWPAKYNHVPMMADWGRSQLYIHRVTPDGPSYTQKDEEFIKLPQITDVDVDASGRMYLSAWDGAGYSGNPAKGYVVRVVPKEWKYKAFPNLKKASVNDLVALLKSEGEVARLHAQQELITRPQGAATAWKLAADKSLPLYARVAGIFAYAQSAGNKATDNLVKLTQENDVREYALKALSDHKPILANVPIKPFMDAMKDSDPRVQLAATIGLGRLGRMEAVPALLAVKVPASFVAPSKDAEGPHATPNPAIIPAHIAVRSLLALNAVDGCLNAIGTENSTIALWALRYMHEPKAVDGLMAAYKKSTNTDEKKQILTTLARLYQKEVDYDGSTWWSTRPVLNGAYYRATDWESSPKIKEFLTAEWTKSNDSGKQFYADLNGRLYMGISEFGGEQKQVAKEEIKVDLEKIKNKKGQIGESSIEDVMLAIANIKGDTLKGKALFTQQGCVACHSIKKGEPLKGPYMGQIGSIMNKERIAESILKPNASISQGFATVLITAKGDKSYMGFVSEESSDKVVMRNIAGQVFNVKTSDILTRKEMETSMMPAGLANALSYEEFASLVTFLSQQKK
jgi:putative heme-binding domain-containing protein